MTNELDLLISKRKLNASFWRNLREVCFNLLWPKLFFIQVGLRLRPLKMTIGAVGHTSLGKSLSAVQLSIFEPYLAKENILWSWKNLHFPLVEQLDISSSPVFYLTYLWSNRGILKRPKNCKAEDTRAF